jgi:hypothetical protein
LLLKSFFFLFFKVSFLRLILSHVFFSIISLRVLALRLALSHVSSNLYRNSSSQPINLSPIKKTFNQSPSKKQTPASSFSESFIASGKQGGGATVLGEGHDIVTRETCIPTSLNKQLRKSSCAAFCLCPLLQLGPCQTAYRSLSTTVLVSNSHRLLIIHSPQRPLKWPLLCYHRKTAARHQPKNPVVPWQGSCCSSPLFPSQFRLLLPACPLGICNQGWSTAQGTLDFSLAKPSTPMPMPHQKEDLRLRRGHNPPWKGLPGLCPLEPPSGVLTACSSCCCLQR